MTRTWSAVLAVTCTLCGREVMAWWKTVWHPGCRFAGAVRKADELLELSD